MAEYQQQDNTEKHS